MCVVRAYTSCVVACLEFFRRCVCIVLNLALDQLSGERVNMQIVIAALALALCVYSATSTTPVYSMGYIWRNTTDKQNAPVAHIDPPGHRSTKSGLAYEGSGHSRENPGALWLVLGL